MEHPTAAGLQIAPDTSALLAGHGEFAWASDQKRRIDARFGNVPAHFRRVFAFVDANIDLPICVADMANCAGVSRFHFIRQFKKTAGMTPRQFVIERRLEKAREMLISGDTALAEVSFASGFSSQSHLCYLFKREFGISPGAYRRAFRSYSRGTAGALPIKLEARLESRPSAQPEPPARAGAPRTTVAPQPPG